jgi:hypothetical protein
LVPISSLRPSGQRQAYYYYTRYSAEAKPARSASLAQFFFCCVQSHSVYILVSKVNCYYNNVSSAVPSVKEVLAAECSRSVTIQLPAAD